MRVFHDKEQGLLRRDVQENRQEGVQGLLFLLLRRHGQGRIVRGQRQREEGGKERDRFGQWQAILYQESLQFAQLLLRRLVRAKRRATRSSRSSIGYRAVFR